VTRSGAALVLLACCGGACSGTEEGGSEVDVSTLTAAPVAAVAEVFGPGISVSSDRSPAVFHGDFNGDGLGDLIAFARTGGGTISLPEGVRVLRPWSGREDPAPEHLSRGVDLTLVVVHGSPGAGTGDGFLLYDPDAASILDTRAARGTFVTDRAGASTLNAEVAGLARGDVLVLPTEAGIDTFVYWDGSTYRAFQPLEYP
jgi:hypothetical protein